VYPPRDQVFAAFNLTPLPDVRVVVIGQDPYHGPGQAHGLSFSVGRGVAVPPSLKNIYQELETDLAGAFKRPSHGNLEAWAKRGVLLLNATRARRAAHGRGLLAAAPPARACTGHESAVLRADLRARLTPRRQ
jgi:uracil-DNA glycosylase